MFGMGTGVTLSVRSPENCELQLAKRAAVFDHPGVPSLDGYATPFNKEGMEAVDNSILMGKSSAKISAMMISL